MFLGLIFFFILKLFSLFHCAFYVTLHEFLTSYNFHELWNQEKQGKVFYIPLTQLTFLQCNNLFSSYLYDNHKLFLLIALFINNTTLLTNYLIFHLNCMASIPSQILPASIFNSILFFMPLSQSLIYHIALYFLEEPHHLVIGNNMKSLERIVPLNPTILFN